MDATYKPIGQQASPPVASSGVRRVLALATLITLLATLFLFFSRDSRVHVHADVRPPFERTLLVPSAGLPAGLVHPALRSAVDLNALTATSALYPPVARLQADWPYDPMRLAEHPASRLQSVRTLHPVVARNLDVPPNAHTPLLEYCTSEIAGACVGQFSAPMNTAFAVRRACDEGLVPSACDCVSRDSSARVDFERLSGNSCACVFVTMAQRATWGMVMNCHV